MNINLHIERLILEGIDLQPEHKNALKAAVESVLGQQLSSQGVGSRMQIETSRSSVNAGSIAIADSPNAEGLGQQIGHAVCGGIRHE